MSRWRLAICLVCLVALAGGYITYQRGQRPLLRSVPIEGGWPNLVIDGGTGHIFVSTSPVYPATGPSTVWMLDGDTGHLLRRTTMADWPLLTAAGSGYVLLLHAASVLDVLDGQGTRRHTLHLYSYPDAFLVEPGTDRLYVVWGAARHGLGRIDLRGGRILRPTTAGLNGTALAWLSGRLFVCDSGPLQVRTIDPADGRVLHTVGFRRSDHLSANCDLAVDAPRDRILALVFSAAIGLSTGTMLYTLSGATGATVHAQPLPFAMAGMAVAQRAGHVFVAGCDEGGGLLHVAMLDARQGTVERTLTWRLDGPGEQLGYPPMAVDERRGMVFVGSGTCGHRAAVWALDATSGRLLRAIGVAGTPFAMAVDEKRGSLVAISARWVAPATPAGHRWLPQWLQRLLPAAPTPRPIPIPASVNIIDIDQVR